MLMSNALCSGEALVTGVLGVALTDESTADDPSLSALFSCFVGLSCLSLDVSVDKPLIFCTSLAKFVRLSDDDSLPVREKW